MIAERKKKGAIRFFFATRRKKGRKTTLSALGWPYRRRVELVPEIVSAGGGCSIRETPDEKGSGKGCYRKKNLPTRADGKGDA